MINTNSGADRFLTGNEINTNYVKEVKKILSSNFRSRPREMHKITCSDCGKEAEVPFKPVDGRPVYCRDCFSKHRKF